MKVGVAFVSANGALISIPHVVIGGVPPVELLRHHSCVISDVFSQTGVTAEIALQHYLVNQ